ncbi:MAG: protein kinase family protein [Clostridia bacterium]|nr:protein kinase family protein [Clostridia bacterium]
MISFIKNLISSQIPLPSKYSFVRYIGAGRFSKCYLITSSNNYYVLKLFRPTLLKGKMDIFFLEKEILSSIKHPSIPKIIDTIINRNIHAHILEYKSGKTIEELIFKDKYSFSRNEIYSIAKQLIDILKHIHNINIVHRDIRIPNVVLDKNQVYLIDFGMARYNNDLPYSIQEYLRS